MNNSQASTRVVISQQQGAPFPFVLPDQSVKVEHLAPETLLALLPTGTVVNFAGSTPPTGFLICDGSSLNRTTYSNLFSVIGTSFGAPDGNSFNIPDLRGRTVVGVGSGPGLTTRSLGSSLGEESHTLSAAELAPHTHSGTTGTDYPDHAHYFITYQDDYAFLSNNQQPPGFARDANSAVANYTSGATARHQHDFGTNSGNGVSGNAHNNMQPSLVLTAIIKF